MVSPSLRPTRYSSKVLLRASRAVRCSPFTPALFEMMQHHSVPLSSVASHAGVQRGYSRYPVTELIADSHAIWLIQTGVLRREVDGQGLTDCFRLTPLGRQLVKHWQRNQPPVQIASWMDYALNWMAKWVRWPNWLGP